MDIIKYVLVGIIVGMANVIPGVSGGTLVVVFNLYDKFVSAITLNVKKLWGNRRFILPLFGGMVLGVLIFSKLVTVLYTRFPLQTNYGFTGLILGSIPLLVKYAWKKEAAVQDDGAAKKPERRSALFHISLALCVLVGLVAIIVFTVLEGQIAPEGIVDGKLPSLSFQLAVKIFIAGVLGAIVMIIPGISGSLIMLIMGVYPIIMAAIPGLFVPETFVRALVLLLPNGVGVLTGLFGGAKLIKWLLGKCPNHTYAVILGLLTGSIYAIFPGVGQISSVLQGVGCVICLIFGACVAFVSNKLDI